MCYDLANTALSPFRYLPLSVRLTLQSFSSFHPLPFRSSFFPPSLFSSAKPVFINEFDPM
uniref:Uncharacterized protein n=1 Tax=Utricularia reniformis TaxID=192314 RepID=A0A1Y0B330_9LAMI|nr:hypothetical protein AEK19_MT1627 [Utricularia reniformis]ART31811.1 hypothetical protein AEK19_MT1627 [Utricularia reniformis]